MKYLLLAVTALFISCTSHEANRDPGEITQAPANSEAALVYEGYDMYSGTTRIKVIEVDSVEYLLTTSSTGVSLIKK